MADDFITTKCVPVQTVGGSGGGDFSNYKDDGSLISHIEAWADGERLEGIKVFYSNSRDGYSTGDQGVMYGNAKGTKFEYTFEPGELITALSIWEAKHKDKANHQHTYCGGFKITTSLNKTFYVKSGSMHNERVIDVGYGAPVGIAGKSGAAIDRLGFYCIRPAKKLSVADVQYATSNLPTPIENNLVDITYKNDTDDEQTHQYEYSYTATQESSWELSSTITDTYSLTISAEIPILEATAGAEASATWEYQQQTTNSASYSTQQQITATYPVIVDPHSQVELNMVYFYGDCTIDFSGAVTLTLDNNQTFTYYAAGTYTGGNTTNISVTLTETALNAQGQVTNKQQVVTEVVPEPEPT